MYLNESKKKEAKLASFFYKKKINHEFAIKTNHEPKNNCL